MTPDNTITSTPALTYGQRAVGLSFNPSGDVNVHKIKSLYAEIIDTLAGLDVEDGESERLRLIRIAITEAQGAQMWAVKAATWTV